jgi:hypothetical protein
VPHFPDLRHSWYPHRRGGGATAERFSVT